MTIVIGLVIAGLVGLAALFYLAAGALAAAAVWAGLPPSYGAAIANAITLCLVLTMGSASLLTVAERKWSAMMQNRIGANRIRFFGTALGGVWYLLADALKMLTKERVEPVGRTRFLYGLAPLLSFAPVFALIAIVPIGPPVNLATLGGIFGRVGTIGLQIASIDGGLLYVFAIASLQVYGTSLAGWASNNKLALLGGVRAASQMISYEVSLGLSLVGTMMAYRTLRLDEMVLAQGTAALGPVPALGILVQPVGFLIFFASAFAETKRAPFDLPEGESEIVGYYVEYSGMKFGLMFLAEFVEIVVLSAIVTAVFLGGWQPIVVSWGTLVRAVGPFWAGAIGAAGFIVKMILMMWLQLTIRWLLPRFRFDQIQKLCWKILLPAALANIFVTGAALLLDPTESRLTLLTALGIVTLITIAVITIATGRAARPETAHGAAHVAGH
jgi:NADH-quinone oxidoreductase subunit H